MQKIHEDAVNHIRQGLQLEKQRDGAVQALTEYELGVGLLQQVNSTFLHATYFPFCLVAED